MATFAADQSSSIEPNGFGLTGWAQTLVPNLGASLVEETEHGPCPMP